MFVIREILAEGVAETLRKSKRQMARGADGVLEWVRDVAAPPAGVELRSLDGAVYSGFFVVDRNRPVMAIAVRHPTPDPPQSSHPQDGRFRQADLADPDVWGRHPLVRP